MGSIPTLGSKGKMAYSRLQSVEEKRNVRKAVYFVLLTIGAIVILFFYGIPILGKFAGFVSDLGKSGKAISINDKTPPAPPRFDFLNNFTNQENLNITGNTEAGATVNLTFNGASEDTLADKDGRFQFSVKLLNGENTYSAMATDAAGNVSQKTQTYALTFDNKPPELTIASPNDGSQFFGSNQRQVTINGNTDTGSQITINDRFVTVDDTGKFQYTTTLNDGENKFKVKSTDQAGNTTEKEITLTFTP